MPASKNCTCVTCGKQRIPETLLTLEDGTRVNECRPCRDPERARRCRTCEQWLPLDAFYPYRRKDQNISARMSDCRVCVLAKRKAGEGFRQKLSSRFKMSLDTYEALLASQNGRCAACGSGEPAAANWHIDHDHACCPSNISCGKCVRGILCRPCNLALGQARDDVARLLGLADYLLFNQATVRRMVPTGGQ